MVILSAQDKISPLLFPETSLPPEAVVLTTAAVGLSSGITLGIRIGDVGGHLLCPVTQWSVLSQGQISPEKDQKGAHCWQPREEVLWRGLAGSLTSLPPPLLFRSSPPPFSPPLSPPHRVERAERYMKL